MPIQQFPNTFRINLIAKKITREKNEFGAYEGKQMLHQDISIEW